MRIVLSFSVLSVLLSLVAPLSVEASTMTVNYNSLNPSLTLTSDRHPNVYCGEIRNAMGGINNTCFWTGRDSMGISGYADTRDLLIGTWRDDGHFYWQEIRGGVSRPYSSRYEYYDFATNSDKLITLDTVTGIEWLSVDVTSGYSINEVLAKTALDYELQKKYSWLDIYEADIRGWRAPTSFEMYSLMADFNQHNLHGNLWMMSHGPARTNSVPPSDATMHRGSGIFMHDGANCYELPPYKAPCLQLSTERHTYYGVTYSGSGSSRVYSIYLNNNHNIGGADARPVIGTGTYLVSDGGLSLSSRLNPMLNTANPNSPYNLGISDGGFSDVSAPAAISVLSLALLGWRRRKAV